MSIWVCNASPLIFLAKINRLALLKNRAVKILVPEGVIDEIAQRKDTAYDEVTHALGDWLEPTHLGSEKLVSHPGLGRGEREVLTLYRTKKADYAVLDDLEARRFATTLGISVIGTLGILLKAKQENEIDSISKELQNLVQHGFRIGPRLISRLSELDRN